MGKMKECAFLACERKHHAKTYCLAHYQQHRRGRALVDPQPIQGSSVAERVEHYSMPLTESGCIVWTGGLNPSGYAILGIKSKSKLAHRIVFESYMGTIPNGMWIDHECGVRSCVNADHLRLATPAENARHRNSAVSNASGYRNVYWVEARGRWVVRITRDGKPMTFGHYADVEEAARVAQSKRRELFGEFAGTI